MSVLKASTLPSREKMLMSRIYRITNYIKSIHGGELNANLLEKKTHPVFIMNLFKVKQNAYHA